MCALQGTRVDVESVWGGGIRFSLYFSTCMLQSLDSKVWKPLEQKKTMKICCDRVLKKKISICPHLFGFQS